MTKQKEVQPRISHKGEDNRTRLIAAATKVLSEQGFEATTVKEIARRAEVSPGLFHYYFASKDELLLEVLSATAEPFAETLKVLRATVPPGELARAALDATKARVTEQPEWYRLRYELHALGLRRPEMLSAVAASLSGARRGISGTLRASREGTERDEDEFLAALLVSCFDGLALQKLADPNFDLERAYDLLYRLTAPVLEPPST